MAMHRPLVLQVVEHPDDSSYTRPFKDGYKVIDEIIQPLTTGSARAMMPEDWEYKILGKGTDSGIALNVEMYS